MKGRIVGLYQWKNISIKQCMVIWASHSLKTTKWCLTQQKAGCGFVRRKNFSSYRTALSIVRLIVCRNSSLSTYILSVSRKLIKNKLHNLCLPKKIYQIYQILSKSVTSTVHMWAYVSVCTYMWRGIVTVFDLQTRKYAHIYYLYMICTYTHMYL